MYHFVQYFYHFTFILLCHWLYHVYIACMFMVLLIFALGKVKIGVTKPILLDFSCPRGEGVCACVGMVCYHCIVHILSSSKNPIFLFSNSNLCRAILPNYLRTCSTALCQIRALKKAFKKQTMAKLYPKSWF